MLYDLLRPLLIDILFVFIVSNLTLCYIIKLVQNPQAKLTFNHPSVSKPENLELASVDNEFAAAAVQVASSTFKEDEMIIDDKTSLLSLPLPSEQQIGSDSDSSKSTPLLSAYDKSQIDTLYTSEERTYREVILVTVAVFMGYASLVVIQKKLYNQFEQNNGGSLTKSQTEIFEHGRY